MYLDNPMSVAYEAAKAAHFGPHPLGQSILGTVESIDGMKVEQMRDYFARQYSPANIVLAFAGKTDWDQVVALAEAHCGDWPGGRPLAQAVPPRGTGAFQAILRAEDQQQTVIGVADAPPLESDDRYAAQLLATILGDHTGSRLYWALIDPGHADGAEVSYQDYNQAGAFYTFLSCEPGRDPGQPRPDRRRLPDRAWPRGSTDEELTQAKNKVLARSVLRSERPMGRLASLGFHWAYRREYLSVAEELEAFSRVTLDDLRRVLDRWPLLPMTVVSVGPTTDVQPPKMNRRRRSRHEHDHADHARAVRRDDPPGRLRAPRRAPRRADLRRDLAHEPDQSAA